MPAICTESQCIALGICTLREHCRATHWLQADHITCDSSEIGGQRPLVATMQLPAMWQSYRFPSLHGSILPAGQCSKAVHAAQLRTVRESAHARNQKKPCSLNHPSSTACHASGRRRAKGDAASAPEPSTVPTTGIRINKCFRDQVSRREADRLVEAGRVQINGLVCFPMSYLCWQIYSAGDPSRDSELCEIMQAATAGMHVQPGDLVTLDGRAVKWEALNVMPNQPASAPPPQFTYIKYYKPEGVVCTTDRRIAGNIVDAVRPSCFSHCRCAAALVSLVL